MYLVYSVSTTAKGTQSEKNCLFERGRELLCMFMFKLCSDVPRKPWSQHVVWLIEIQHLMAPVSVLKTNWFCNVSTYIPLINIFFWMLSLYHENETVARISSSIMTWCPFLVGFIEKVITKNHINLLLENWKCHSQILWSMCFIANTSYHFDEISNLSLIGIHLTI